MALKKIIFFKKENYYSKLDYYNVINISIQYFHLQKCLYVYVMTSMSFHKHIAPNSESLE